MDIETQLSRREPRLACDPTGVRAHLKGSDRHFTGQIVEVSRTGVQIQIDEAVPVGSVMTVEFAVHPPDWRHSALRVPRRAIHGRDTNQRRLVSLKTRLTAARAGV